MTPWCAEGEVPTDANLNLQNSCVRWHCDDEPLSGRVGTSKLIVSVSFGSRASFKWKGKSCPDGEVSSCCIGHGDIFGHGWPKPGRVPSLYGSRSGPGAD